MKLPIGMQPYHESLPFGHPMPTTPPDPETDALLGEILEAHHISDEVEAAIQQAFPDAEVLTHQDPAGVEPVAHMDNS